MIPLDKNISASYLDFYYESIEEYVLRKKTKHSLTKLDKAVERYFSPIIISFKDLITATPSKLELIVNQFNQYPEYRKNVISKVLDLSTLYSALNKGNFKTHKNGNKLNTELHFKYLNVENCPYCNENKIVSWKKTSIQSELKRSYDWDHFFPYSFFPFLAVSIFNLIPSCKVCNFLKLDSPVIGLNPFYSYSIDNLLSFTIKADNLKYFDSTDNFEIKKIIPHNVHGNKLESMLNTIFIEKRYSESKQMLKFLFRKNKAYSRSKLLMFERLIGGLSAKRKKEFFELYFNVYTAEKEYKHMVYSKLIADVLFKKNTH